MKLRVIEVKKYSKDFVLKSLEYKIQKKGWFFWRILEYIAGSTAVGYWTKEYSFSTSKEAEAFIQRYIHHKGKRVEIKVCQNEVNGSSPMEQNQI